MTAGIIRSYFKFLGVAVTLIYIHVAVVVTLMTLPNSVVLVLL